MMRAKAEQSHVIPGSTRTRIAAETIRGWITDYRRGGFEVLYPKRRTDRDQPRRLPPEVAERLIALKTASPNQSARVEGIDHPLAPSSRPIPDLFVDKAFAADPAMPRFFAAGRCDFGR
ncbi:MAG: helix-turn-helix domain containing protein [Rhodospirillales bacterium]|nr:helix-turn-helix domain containing protein [Rhodospirillales bacterium]